jgi:hypothetical protein
MQVFNSFQEVYAANSGVPSAQSKMSVFNMGVTSELPRQSVEWLKENFFSYKLAMPISELTYEHKATGNFIVLDYFFSNEQEAMAFHRKLVAEITEEDTADYTPAKQKEDGEQ